MKKCSIYFIILLGYLQQIVLRSYPQLVYRFHTINIPLLFSSSIFGLLAGFQKYGVFATEIAFRAFRCVQTAFGIVFRSGLLLKNILLSFFKSPICSGISGKKLKFIESSQRLNNFKIGAGNSCKSFQNKESSLRLARFSIQAGIEAILLLFRMRLIIFGLQKTYGGIYVSKHEHILSFVSGGILKSTLEIVSEFLPQIPIYFAFFICIIAFKACESACQLGQNQHQTPMTVSAQSLERSQQQVATSLPFLGFLVVLYSKGPQNSKSESIKKYIA